LLTENIARDKYRANDAFNHSKYIARNVIERSVESSLALIKVHDGD